MTTIEDVLSVIESEGFDYTFADYSSFEDVDDDEFHELREGFLNARKRLVRFLQRFGELDV